MIPALMSAVAQAGDSYARLAAAMPEREWIPVQTFLEGGAPVGLPSYVPLNATPLETARAIALRYANLLESIRRTTDGVDTPTSKVDPASSERLVAFVVSTAHVRFADGKRHEGVSLLLDGLTLAYRWDDGAAQRTVVDAIRRDKDALPLSECDRIRKAADAWLGKGLEPEAARRLALVRVRMRVEAYRWRYGKPPGSLADAAPTTEILDPARGKAFAYQRTDVDYRLGEENGSGFGSSPG